MAGEKFGIASEDGVDGEPVEYVDDPDALEAREYSLEEWHQAKWNSTYPGDHEHCDRCGRAFSDEPYELHEGYTNQHGAFMCMNCHAWIQKVKGDAGC